MRFDKIFTKEFLLLEYKQKQKTKFQIAQEQNTTCHTINHYLKKHNIENNTMIKRNKLEGLKFNRWYVINVSHSDKLGRIHYNCICDCGTKKVVSSSSLIKNLSKSCGCYKRKLSSKGYKEISGTFWRKFHESAQSRGLKFEITIEQIWDLYVKQNGKCVISGLPIYFCSNNDKAFLQTASIDRIDSNEGYVITNVQLVHKKINFLKSNMTDNELIWWCRQINNFNIQKNIPEINFQEYKTCRRYKYENNKQKNS